MTAQPKTWTVDNPAWAGAMPWLSVLIPFFRDDPGDLLQALGAEAARLCGSVETVTGLAAPARLIRLAANEGRARGRNRLLSAARARHVLFLDADMLPDGPRFLGSYLTLIDEEDPAVAFGGFTLDRTPDDPERGLHRAMSLRGDCRPAAVRALEPAKSLCTSNLLARREVFELEPFDETFTGWGWEDVEWAIRVGRRWNVRHIDNPASHLGLDRDAALIAKYEQSPPNFGRMGAKHPDVAVGFPIHRAARRLSHLPLRGLWRPWLRRLALSRPAPMLARVAAAKLYRAALYAEVV